MPQARVLLWAVVVIGACSVLLLSSFQSQLIGSSWITPATQIPARTHSGVTYHAPHLPTSRTASQVTCSHCQEAARTHSGVTHTDTPHSSTSPSTSQQSLNTTEPPHRSTVLFGCLEGVVTVQTGGRFGNAFMEYATALGVARVYNLTLVLPEYIARSLQEAFEGVEGPTLAEFIQGRNGSDGVPCAPRLPESVVYKDELRWKSGDREPVQHGDGPIVIRRWVVHEKFIVPLIPYLRATLRYRPNLRDHAQNLLRSLGEKVAAAAAGAHLEEDPMHKVASLEAASMISMIWDRELEKRKEENNTLITNLERNYNQITHITFIGVHVRRTDYHRWLKVRLNVTKSVDASYYARALAWLHATLGERSAAVSTAAARTDGATPAATKPLPVAVAITSDDMQWVEERLLPTLQAAVDKEEMNMTIFAVGTTGPQAALKDLATLSACNHSVISYGTYGLTAALLAGGRTVVYDLHHPYYATEAFAALIPGWTKLT